MARKILIDCDPGIDDAIALCFSLFHTELELVGITACEGAVSAQQVNRNVASVVNLLDPPKRPRLGMATAVPNAPHDNVRYLHGDDGLANLSLDIDLQHTQSAEKVMVECVRNYPNDVTFVCLGPLTNVAGFIQRQPALAKSIDRIVIAGGSVNGIGNITPCAEFNMYFDPVAAKTVMQSATTKTLVPLDVTSQLRFDLSFMDSLPKASSRAGHFLRHSLPVLFRSFRQHLAMEDIMLRDLIGLIGCVQANLFQWEEMAVDVETGTGLTRGMTVFDRRYPQEWTNNLEVAVSMEEQAVQDVIIEGLRWAGQQS